jgi:hypothetical protein
VAYTPSDKPFPVNTEADTLVPTAPFQIIVVNELLSVSISPPTCTGLLTEANGKLKVRVIHEFAGTCWVGQVPRNKFNKQKLPAAKNGEVICGEEIVNDAVGSTVPPMFRGTVDGGAAAFTVTLAVAGGLVPAQFVAVTL